MQPDGTTARSSGSRSGRRTGSGGGASDGSRGAQVRRRRRSSSEAAIQPVPGPAWWGRALALLVLPVAVWVFWHGGTTMRADLASAEARHLLDRIRMGKAQPQDELLDEVARGLAVAARLTPTSPELHVAFGDLSLARSGSTSVTSAPDADARRQQQLNQALDHYRQALALQPSAFWIWLRAASVQDDMKNTEGLWSDWRRALALGPNEWSVQAAGLRYALQDWDQAPADVRDWAVQLYVNADAVDRARINNLAMGYNKEFAVEDDDPTGATAAAGQQSPAASAAASASAPAAATATASTALPSPR